MSADRYTYLDDSVPTRGAFLAMLPAAALGLLAVAALVWPRRAAALGVVLAVVALSLLAGCTTVRTSDVVTVQARDVAVSVSVYLCPPPPMFPGLGPLLPPSAMTPPGAPMRGAAW